MKILLTVLLLLAQSAVADTMAEEIDRLLGFVATSDCSMIRNGKLHSAEEGVKHISSFLVAKA